MAKRILDTDSLNASKILTRGDIRWKQMAHFEAGLLTPSPVGFDAIAGVVANLAVKKSAAIRGDYGFEVTAAGVGSDAYGRFVGINNKTEVALEFYFDPSNLTVAVADVFDMVNTLSAAPASVQGFVVVLRNLAGTLQLRAIAKDDASGNVFPWNYDISGGIEKVRLEWKAASIIGANDGIFNLYIDDVFQMGISNLDNDTHAITEIQIGTTAGLDVGTSGTIDFDNIGWIDKFL